MEDQRANDTRPTMEERLDSHARDERFRRIFRRYHQPVRVFFSNRGFGSEECLDLTQETFLRVFKSMETLRREAMLESWLLRIAANVWKNELRRRSAEKRDGKETSLDSGPHGSRPAEMAGTTVDAGSLRPLDKLLVKEQAALLRQALNVLPAQMRRCVLMRVDQELKYREIAAVMQLSIETVKSQIHQARQRLRSELDRYRAEES